MILQPSEYLPTRMRSFITSNRKYVLADLSGVNITRLRQIIVREEEDELDVSTSGIKYEAERRGVF